MSKQKKFTRKQVVEALKLTGGFICHTADLLDCHYSTISRYIKDDPSIAEEQKDIIEARLDLAESVLILHIEAESLDAAKWYLKYMGRARGYIKAQKIEISDDLSELMKAADEREGL